MRHKSLNKVYCLFTLFTVGFLISSCGVKTTPKSTIEDFRPEASYLKTSKEQADEKN